MSRLKHYLNYCELTGERIDLDRAEYLAGQDYYEDREVFEAGPADDMPVLMASRFHG